ncbi:colanic acid/amylovoran biosynthesis protein [Lachnospiraceae bacterium NE2001]|nr:colanic acid/amylovoran biosynthesis protein [Lachnospiraceae bacterium NE2001]
MGRKIMIVGANFGDKGSQAKLYVVIDELRKRFSDCEIFYAHNDEQLDGSLYRFGKIPFTKKTQSQVLKANPLSNITKLFRKKDDSSSGEKDVVEMVSQMELIIDVSEHSLTSDSSMADIEYYLNNIKIAKKYKIPMIIMPQSFGPFDFDVDTMYILGDMKDILFYPKAIFTREQYGYDEMMGYFGLDNLRQANDMLLVDNNFDLSNVCSRFYRPEIPDIPEENNVAVIPNAAYFDKKNNDQTFEMYKMMFEALNAAGKNVYIVCQCSSDMDICKELASKYMQLGNVDLVDKELDSVEFTRFLKKFEMVISSRYEACVQSYRNFLPVLLLGSGANFKELTELLGQEKYYFDVLSEQCNKYDVVDALNDLIKNWDVARTRVQTRMINIRTTSCFEIFDELKW